MKCWKYQQLCESSYHNKFGIQVTLRSRDALAGSATWCGHVRSWRPGTAYRCGAHAMDDALNRVR
jgi:hypothetical protein